MKSLTFVLGTFLVLCLSVVNLQAQTAPTAKACQKTCSKVCDKSKASTAVVNPEGKVMKEKSEVVNDKEAKAVLVNQTKAEKVVQNQEAAKKVNCNPANCKPVNCNPADCNPANCNPANCKKGEKKGEKM